jgi:hypothetical protein
MLKKADEAQARAALVRQAVMSHERLGKETPGEKEDAA